MWGDVGPARCRPAASCNDGRVTRELEFYFDYSCPYAYLASTRVRELADKTGARLAYRPFLLGGVAIAAACLLLVTAVSGVQGAALIRAVKARMGWPDAGGSA